MKYRGWKYRSYADEPETPVANFLCGVIGGSIAFYNFIGWVFISLGILTGAWVAGISAGVGVMLGLAMIWPNTQEREDKGLENDNKN